MQIIIVRHGESTTNLINDNIFTGQFDCDLTEYGIKQAYDLKNNKIFEGVDAYYSSDLIRAKMTAKIITDKSVTLDKRLRERSLGDFEGKLIEKIKKEKRYEKYFNDPKFKNFRHDFTIKAPNGESYSDVYNRVNEFYQEISNKGCNKIVIVSHMCAIRCLLKAINGISNEDTLNIEVGNCDYIVIENK
jgi:2,3-bisphosphoglycerate-dependent phosphoglycerate mutase